MGDADRSPSATTLAAASSTPRTGLVGSCLPADASLLAADVFVLPSISEGLSNALLEAMACGLAVLASRVGGSAEAVADGGAGFLFEPQDLATLRARIAQLLAPRGSPSASGFGRARTPWRASTSTPTM